MSFNRWPIALLIMMEPLLSFAVDHVVINEIQYNPPDESLYEFIELYNPTRSTIDLSGYAFIEGIEYAFPEGSSIPAQGYLLVVKNPSDTHWNQFSRIKMGPYIGKLSDQGEEIVLRSPDGHEIDRLTYCDFDPWPRGADGYGPSLERISPDLPSDDYHSWKASRNRSGGSPQAENTVIDTLDRPAIVSFEIRPEHPTSLDDVEIHVSLDTPDTIQQVELRYETVFLSSSESPLSIPMELNSKNPESAVYQAALPPQPSQTLVRFNFNIERVDGKTLRLPDRMAPRPFESYFVYDNEIPSLLPILWIFPYVFTRLHVDSMAIRGVAVKPVESETIELYDGTRIESSLVDNSGLKVKFLKGEEYRGDRTINIGPEVSTHPNSGGPQTSHTEQMGLWIFQDFDVLTPRCDWYRAIEGSEHTQRAVTQQPNECFLELNNRDPNSNIYKIAYNESNSIPGMSNIHYAKKTNLDEGNEDLYEFIRTINSADSDESARALRLYLNVDEVINYSVAGVLLSNWDGFFNNMFLVHSPQPVDKWECVPWDLDKTFGYTDGYPPHSTMFVEMPLAFPLDGRADLAARTPGPVSRAVHKDAELNAEYLRRVREALDGRFSEERMIGTINATETLLLQDLALLEETIGRKRNDRREQIEDASETMRTFIRLRREFLLAQPELPVPVRNWEIY